MKAKALKIIKLFGIHCLTLITVLLIISILLDCPHFSYQAFKKDVENYNRYTADARNHLFKNYQPQIDMKKYPKTFSAFLKLKKQDSLIIPKYNQKKHDSLYLNDYSKTQKSLIEQLQPKNSKKNLIEGGYRNFDNSGEQIYYDGLGNLLFVQFSIPNKNGDKTSLNTYRYDSKGRLIEAEYWDGHKPNIILDKNKQLKFYCSHLSCSSAKEIDSFISYIFDRLKKVIFWTYLIFILLAPIFIPASIIWLIITTK